MKIVLQIGQNLPILPNISTTTEPVSTSVSALVEVYIWIIKLTSFAVVQGMLHGTGNELILDDFCRRQN